MRVAPSGDESAAGDDVMHGLTLLRTDGAAEEHMENVRWVADMAAKIPFTSRFPGSLFIK